jgi:septal ring factor EnvC (AmiA/AmiB activator)
MGTINETRDKINAWAVVGQDKKKYETLKKQIFVKEMELKYIEDKLREVVSKWNDLRAEIGDILDLIRDEDTYL